MGNTLPPVDTSTVIGVLQLDLSPLLCGGRAVFREPQCAGIQLCQSEFMTHSPQGPEWEAAHNEMIPLLQQAEVVATEAPRVCGCLTDEINVGNALYSEWLPRANAVLSKYNLQVVPYAYAQFRSGHWDGQPGRDSKAPLILIFRKGASAPIDPNAWQTRPGISSTSTYGMNR